MKLNVRFLFILYSIFVFFMSLNIKFIGHFYFNIAFILTCLSLFTLLIINYRKFLGNIVFASKYNSLKYFLYFLIYIICSTLILSAFGRADIVRFLVYLINFSTLILLTLFCAYLTASKILKTRTLIKIIYGMLFFIFVMGIIDFIAYYSDITPIQYILTFFNNEQAMKGKVFEKAFSFGFPRLQSIYAEPSHMGWIIFMFSPVIYSLSLCKERIFENKFANLILKKTMIPLAWINLILTQSPMFIVLVPLSTIIYFHKETIQFIKARLIRVSLTSLVLLSLIIFTTNYTVKVFNVDISQTYLQRIKSAVESFGDYDRFVLNNSLATRITLSISNVLLWTKYPILGVGWGQITPYMETQLLNSPITLSRELEMKSHLEEGEGFSSAVSFIFRVLAETGIIGTFLLLLFFLKTISNIKRIEKNTEGFEKIFAKGLYGTVISIVLLYLYDISMYYILPWFLIGISMGLYNKTIQTDKMLIEDRTSNGG